jgi:hypothetical protein
VRNIAVTRSLTAPWSSRPSLAPDLLVEADAGLDRLVDVGLLDPPAIVLGQGELQGCGLEQHPLLGRDPTVGIGHRLEAGQGQGNALALLDVAFGVGRAPAGQAQGQTADPRHRGDQRHRRQAQRGAETGPEAEVGDPHRAADDRRRRDAGPGGDVGLVARAGRAQRSEVCLQILGRGDHQLEFLAGSQQQGRFVDLGHLNPSARRNECRLPGIGADWVRDGRPGR